MHGSAHILKESLHRIEKFSRISELHRKVLKDERKDKMRPTQVFQGFQE